MNVYNLRVLYTWQVDYIYLNILVNDITHLDMVVEIQMYNDNQNQLNNIFLHDSSPIGVLFDSVIRREVSTKFINLIRHTLG